MTSYKFIFVINGLHDVIKEKDEEMKVDNVLFSFDGTYYLASVISRGETNLEAEKTARYLVSLALSKIVFAYHTEAFIDDKIHNYIDLDNEPTNQVSSHSFTMRWNYADGDPKEILTKLVSIKSEKNDNLHLALAYYQLSNYFNPLRLETLFSSLTVLIRDILGKDKIITSELKDTISSILKNTGPNFDHSRFEIDWNECYTNERCSISHGRLSKLIDVRNESEYFRIVNKVSRWTRMVFYYYIDINQNTLVNR